MDIVGYSKLVIDKQTELSRKLNEIVRNAPQFQITETEGALVRPPRGDGIVLGSKARPPHRLQPVRRSYSAKVGLDEDGTETAKEGRSGKSGVGASIADGDGGQFKMDRAELVHGDLDARFKQALSHRLMKSVSILSSDPFLDPFLDPRRCRR